MFADRFAGHVAVSSSPRPVRSCLVLSAGYSCSPHACSEFSADMYNKAASALQSAWKLGDGMAAFNLVRNHSQPALMLCVVLPLLVQGDIAAASRKLS